MIVDKISRDLGLSIEYLNSLQNKNNLYKIYVKGNRVIKHPSKELKIVQYWLNKNIFSQLPVSKYATAYEPKCSIKLNALAHKNNKYILHLDIHKFFPSIGRNNIENLLYNYKSNLNISLEDINYILNIILFKGEELAVGGVSSPCIANRLLYDFDENLVQYLKLNNFNYIYTRYADDIYISSNNKINNEVIEYIEKRLLIYNLHINKDKTYYMYNGNKRQITGIIINNKDNTLSIGTDRMRKLKRKIYNFLVKGNSLSEKDEMLEFEKLKGYLAFVRNINEQQYNLLSNIYKKYQKSKYILFKE